MSLNTRHLTHEQLPADSPNKTVLLPSDDKKMSSFACGMF